MRVTVDNAGNVRGRYPGNGSCKQPLLLGSHLDTVRNAGAFDGILGVILAIQLVSRMDKGKLPFDIEVVGFSEEEGVRFGIPFIGSHAVAGSFSSEILGKKDATGSTVADAIKAFGLDPALTAKSVMQPKPIAFLEFHIEQGPVLDHANEGLAIVNSIVGLTRAFVTFTGHANHAGTTPLNLRRDALCGAAEWITSVEQKALSENGLLATVGKLDVAPGMANAIPGEAKMTLDCRHANDAQRNGAVEKLRLLAEHIANRRSLALDWAEVLNQKATLMDPGLVQMLDSVACESGLALRRMSSGAGHDAMVMAQQMPSIMLFLRSTGGISHHPDEDVLAEDIDQALLLGGMFIKRLSEQYKEWGES